jgi:dTDP-4-dehydrorhamnose reductase
VNILLTGGSGQLGMELARTLAPFGTVVMPGRERLDLLDENLENDAVQPLGVYRRSKHAGEVAVLAAGGPCLIFRTSWLYGARGRNFLRTMLHLARTRETMEVVDDQTGCPTWHRIVAQAVALVLARLMAGDRFDLPEPARGIYHLAAAGSTSWFGFAREILARDPRRDEQIVRELRPVATSAFPRPARRPRFSVLDTSRFTRTFGFRMPDWRDQLALVLGEAPVAEAASATLRP